MIIYIDLVILSTFLINYAFIKLIYIVNHLKYQKIRLYVSSLIATLSIILYFIPYKYIYIIRHLYGFIIGLCAFKTKSFKQKLKHIISFYILNYLFIGTLSIFKVDNIIYIILVLLLIITLYIIEKIKVDNFIINVNILNKSLKTLVDTGNKCFYQNIPITFIKKEHYSKEFMKVSSILTKCMNEEILVDIYIGPSIYINDEEKISYFAFVDLEEYDCILSDELGG